MPLSAPNLPEGNNHTQTLFTPPSGGDITLRSSDGVDFIAHSSILKLASTTFDNMLVTHNAKTPLDLTEKSSDVSLLLQFIYPNRFPLTLNPDILPGSLAVVRKYGVEGAIEIIDQLIAFDNSPHKPLSSDPTRSFRLAMQFNLAKTKSAAAQIIIADQVDFCDLNKAAEHTHKYSSPGLIYLMNIQAMRAKLLSDVLFRFDQPPIQPANANFDMYWRLSCQDCRSNSSRQVFNKVPPSWVLAWTRLVYETLLISSEPLAKSDHLFCSNILKKLTGREDVCQTCLSDFNSYGYSQRPAFDRWAEATKEVLEARLAKLDLAYML